MTFRLKHHVLSTIWMIIWYVQERREKSTPGIMTSTETQRQKSCHCIWGRKVKKKER